jgi:hypothetical protein
MNKTKGRRRRRGGKNTFHNILYHSSFRGAAPRKITTGAEQTIFSFFLSFFLSFFYAVKQETS